MCPHKCTEALRSAVGAKADAWLMHPKSLQKGDSVPARSDAGILLELQFPHEQCQGEKEQSNSCHSGCYCCQRTEPAETSVKYSPLSRQWARRNRFNSEINLFYWFKGLLKSLKKHLLQYRVRLWVRCISYWCCMTRYTFLGTDSWIDMVDYKWTLDLNTVIRMYGSKFDFFSEGFE